uniref:Putative larval cuticle protein lcp-30 n=1 Tax=Anopheles marajoara TaxID=58244 RepID=A0A2M4C0R3_9DIPT
MRIGLVLLCFGSLLALGYGQNDGKYRPSPGNDGRYIHVDNKYKHSEGNADSGSRIQRDNVGVSSGTKSATGSDESATTKPETILSAILPIPTHPPNVIRMYRLPPPLLGGKKMFRLENQIHENGYHYIYQKEDGVVSDETGHIEESGTPGERIMSKGFYQYDEDGEFFQINYTAVGNYYRPWDGHVPKVPPAIERLLRYLASKPK